MACPPYLPARRVAEHATVNQLLSVISLLSSDTPNLDSPSNVDAAKVVRNDIDGRWPTGSFGCIVLILDFFRIQEEGPTLGEAQFRGGLRLTLKTNLRDPNSNPRQPVCELSVLLAAAPSRIHVFWVLTAV